MTILEDEVWIIVFVPLNMVVVRRCTKYVVHDKVKPFLRPLSDASVEPIPLSHAPLRCLSCRDLRALCGYLTFRVFRKVSMYLLFYSLGSRVVSFSDLPEISIYVNSQLRIASSLTSTSKGLGG